LREELIFENISWISGIYIFLILRVNDE